MPRSEPALATAAKPFNLSRKWTASQQIYADLRERIINLDIPPGTPVSRSELADFYNVSPTPLRDAMMKLEQDGLLHVFPQSKTIVSRIDVQNARETQFLRTAIELEVVRSLTEAPDPPLEEPKRLLAAQEACAGDRDRIDTFNQLDRAFHRSLCAAAGHEALSDLVVDRSGHLDRLRRLHLPSAGKVENILTHHRALIDAIESGDPARSTGWVRAHLSGTLQVVDDIIARHPEFF